MLKGALTFSKPSGHVTAINTMRKITLKQKRFLIVWTLCNTFALCTSELSWNGWLTSNFALFNAHVHLNDFWPVTSFIDGSRFLGLLNGYDIDEYIVYMSIGLAIVFLPKLWRE